MSSDRRVGSALVGWVIAVVILLATGWALATSQPYAVAAVVLVAAVSVAVIAGASPSQLGVVLVAAFCFTASWDEVEMAGANPRHVFLLGGVAFLVLGQATRGRPPVPWWVHSFGLTAVGVTLAQVLFPVSETFLASRYLTSEAGTALGERPDVVPSLSYLLLNVYVVPVAIVLAVMAVPRAMRWLIAAFVAGVALSSLAGYLGFIGMPWLVDLLATPLPAGFRALGYTSHPLHLATSGVFALGLAVWMAVQPGAREKWLGRVSTVAIVLGLYASGSRGGVVGGLVLLALCLVLLPRVRRRAHAVLAVAVTIVALVALYVPAIGDKVLRTTRITGTETGAASSRGRSQILDQSIADFLEAPFIGIGTRFLAEAHVLYIGVLAAGGVVLFVGYVLFSVGSLRAAVRLLKVDPALGGALLATLLASLAYWTVADDFQVARVQIVYGLLIAALLPAPAPEHSAPTGPSADEPIARFA